MALGAKKSVCPSNDVASRFSTLSWLRHVKKAIWGQHPAAATRVVLLDSVSPPPPLLLLLLLPPPPSPPCVCVCIRRQPSSLCLLLAAPDAIAAAAAATSSAIVLPSTRLSFHWISKFPRYHCLARILAATTTRRFDSGESSNSVIGRVP